MTNPLQPLPLLPHREHPSKHPYWSCISSCKPSLYFSILAYLLKSFWSSSRCHELS